MAIGSFGLRPGQSAPRIEMWPNSFNGELEDKLAKRSASASAGMLSTLEMHRVIVTGLCGGATESALIRPREGSSGSKAAFDGISQSLV